MLCKFSNGFFGGGEVVSIFFSDNILCNKGLKFEVKPSTNIKKYLILYFNIKQFFIPGMYNNLFKNEQKSHLRVFLEIFLYSW